MSALDSGQSPQAVDIERNLAQIIFDALRQLIREEIDAALKHTRSIAATKKATRRGVPRPSRHPVSPRSLDVVRG
jgi:hypothetical protein